MSDCPQTRALLAGQRADLAGIHAQLDLLSDDELIGFGHALWEVATELRSTMVNRGCEPCAPMGDVLGDGWDRPNGRRCPAPDCDRELHSTRARYCSGRCRMRALRQRRLMTSRAHVVDMSDRGARRVDHSVYECQSCGERFLGVRRCPECNLFARNLGFGGACPDCDCPILLTELLPDLNPMPVAKGRTAREVTAGPV